MSYAVHSRLDVVNADGGLYMATPLDLVFLLLPILETAAAQVSKSSVLRHHSIQQMKRSVAASAAVHQLQRQPVAACAVSMTNFVIFSGLVAATVVWPAAMGFCMSYWQLPSFKQQQQRHAA